MKKFVSTLLALCICFSSLGVCASAASEVTASLSIAPDSIKMSVAEKSVAANLLMDIPVFITTIGENTEEEKEAIQESVKEEISIRLNATAQQIRSPGSEIFVRETQNYQIAELTDTDKNSLIDNPMFANTIRRVTEIAESGVHVTSLNFYMKENPMKVTRANDPDDIDYWETYCEPLEGYKGEYKGYKFLYLESEATVGTDEVVPGNVDNSFNWGTFLRKSAKTVATELVGEVAKPLTLAVDAVSNIVGSISTPLNVTYGRAEEGYIRTWVDGFIYIRDVLIRDDLDRVKGYAYYSWATTEQTRLQQGVKCYAPVSQRTATTYNYEYAANYGPVRTASTDGFKGNAAFYDKVIQLYNNTIGYSTYHEYIDTYSLITSIVS